MKTTLLNPKTNFMTIKINPVITIAKAKKNKNYGLYTKLTPDNSAIEIRAVSHSGRKRGVVGKISKDGFIDAENNVKKHITPTIRQKIDFVVDLILNNNLQPITV
mgnify:CR=1 FL=1